MNRFIDFIVTKQGDQVFLSWNHCVAFPLKNTGFRGAQGSNGMMGIFGAQGACGATGAFGIFEKDGKKYKRITAPRTEMPEVLKFTVKFADEKDYIFYSTLLKEHCEDVPNMVLKKFVEPEPIKRATRLKQEFVAIEQQEKEQEKEDLQKALDLINQAETLGYYIGDADFHSKRCSKITSDCYEEFGEQKFTMAEIHILCHKDSAVYRELDKYGLLQKYCPASYRQGDSYSVNGGPMNKQPIIDVLVE